MSFTIEYQTKHSNQHISLWSIMDQKEINVKRTVYTTARGDSYAKHKGCLVSLRGQAGSYWHGKW